MNIPQEIQSLLLGGFAGLLAFIPNMINSIRNYKFKHNLTDFIMVMRNYSIDQGENQKVTKELFKMAKETVTDVTSQIRQTTAEAKKTLAEDVAKTSEIFTTKTKEFIGQFNDEIQDLKSYVRSFKDEVIAEMKKEFDNYVDNVVEILKERQSQVSDD